MLALAPLAATYFFRVTGWGLLLYAIIYLIPAAIAIARRGRFWVPALIVDILLAWTLIGWVVALVLSLLGPQQRAQPIRG